jgi:hypothetical protein
VTLRQAAFMQGSDHNADVFRDLVGSLVSQGGVAGPYDLVPAVSPTGGMKIRVGPGSVFWTGSVPFQGVYHAANDDYFDVPLTGANATLPRIDLIVARLRDPDFVGASPSPWTLVAITGTPNQNPQAPYSLVTANDEVIAQVAVSAAVTGIASDKIVSRRRLARMRSAQDIGTVADRDRLIPYNGMVIYRTDLQQQQWYQGGSWYAPVVQAADGSVRIQGDVFIFGGSARLTTDYLTVGGNANVGGSIASNSLNATLATVQQTLQVGGNVVSGGTYIDRSGRDLLTLIGFGGFQTDTQAVSTEIYLRKQGSYVSTGTLYGQPGTFLTFVQGSGAAIQIFTSGGGISDSTDGRGTYFAVRGASVSDPTKWGIWRRMQWPALEMWADIVTVAAPDGTKADGTTFYSPNFTFPANRFSATPCVTVMPYTATYNNLLSGAGVMVYDVTATGGSARVDFPAGKTGSCSFMVTAMYQG